MLVIRMQRTGRKGHAMFRVVVQDSRRTPTSGKAVAALGSYDPHAKTAQIDKEKAQHYLDHGAQPSDRVALLLKAEGVKLPKWVKAVDKKEGAVRNPDKRRSTRPDEPEAPAEEAPVEEAAAEAPAEAAEETPATEEAPGEEPAAEEAPSEEAATEPEAPAEEPATEAEETEAEKPAE